MQGLTIYNLEAVEAVEANQVCIIKPNKQQRSMVNRLMWRNFAGREMAKEVNFNTW